jgi:hypothetical protein
MAKRPKASVEIGISLSKLPASGIHAQICGDAHVRNFGAYAAPDGRLVSPDHSRSWKAGGRHQARADQSQHSVKTVFGCACDGKFAGVGNIAILTL